MSHKNDQFYKINVFSAWYNQEFVDQNKYGGPKRIATGRKAWYKDGCWGLISLRHFQNA